MKKRLQIALSDEALATVELLIKQANKDFETGHITYSDAINEMIMTSKVDIKTLQDKHTDVRRSLKSFAKQDDPDLDSLIKTLTELKKQKHRLKTKDHQTEMPA
jgi:septation ring formation regulator EzrA